MSHQATNWAIQQRGLRPATKIVLWHLCDRHNPDQGCYPSQERLAEDCEVSRSSLNEHLNLLEAKGLMRREQRVDPITRRQLSTRYIFAFEPEFAETQDVVEPCPESGQGAESGNQPEPSPENRDFRVQIPDTNPVREPVIEPQGAQARGGEDFEILWSEWPEDHRPDNRQHVERLFEKLTAEDQSKVRDGARPYRKAMALRGKPARMVTFIKDRQFLDFHDDPELDKDGYFVIRPKSPEWRPWMGHIRQKHGERGIESVLKVGRYLTLQRHPAEHVSA